MKNLQITGAVFTLLFGTLLHFSYAFLGKTPLSALFGAVNESTWEHLKLLAVPMLLFGVLEYLCYGRHLQNFVPVRLLSVLLGMGVIVAAFYTYVGVFGQHCLWADIGTFVLGVLAAYGLSARILGTSSFSSVWAQALGWAGLLALVTCLAVFTFSPPTIALFRDPVSGRFGR